MPISSLHLSPAVRIIAFVLFKETLLRQNYCWKAHLVLSDQTEVQFWKPGLLNKLFVSGSTEYIFVLFFSKDTKWRQLVYVVLCAKTFSQTVQVQSCQQFQHHFLFLTTQILPNHSWLSTYQKISVIYQKKQQVTYSRHFDF